ncbi:glycosyltransferase [Kitasatospora sp. RB6PN24]|uniref:glycosyltransferase family 2 protein n=1 Tax=Kitasatospora humi TaxID=2893891 RepID=UPI001E54311B|nr:glycosyltransferase [Kitasatospora humi]MCC9305910.1 glycosyltransferase [Kitasatospora humi]
MASSRIGVVVITHNRREELLHSLAKLRELPERPPVVVVDNGSTDGTAEAVGRHFPAVRLLRPGRNLGACARNLAARTVDWTYLAFCDDDTWWTPGALARAADLLDTHPSVATVTARILLDLPGRRPVEDPIVAELRDSPVPGPPGLPWPVLGSFLAGATVIRSSAFRTAGGFSPRLWLGGEEELLAADLAATGWWLVYADELAVHHRPSALRDPTLRRRHGIRNTLWFSWLRRPVGRALLRTAWLACTVPRDAVSARAFADALAGLPWVLRERRQVPARVERGLRLLERPQRASRARRYIG